MSKAAAIRAILETRTLRIIGLIGTVSISVFFCALAFLYFEWWLGVWLVALATITYASPGWGLGLLFLTVSMDPARPVVGGIIVSYSEIQIAAFLSSWWAGGLWRERKLIHDWRLASWCAPFLFIMLVSGLLSSSVPRAVGNSMRVAEMFILVFAVANLLKDSSGPGFRVFLLVGCLFYSLLGVFQFPFVEWGRILLDIHKPEPVLGLPQPGPPLCSHPLPVGSPRGTDQVGLCVCHSAGGWGGHTFTSGFSGHASWRVYGLASAFPPSPWAGPETNPRYPDFEHPLPCPACSGRNHSSGDSAAGPFHPEGPGRLPSERHRTLQGRICVFLSAVPPTLFRGRVGNMEREFLAGCWPGNYARGLEEKEALLRSYREVRKTHRIFIRSIQFSCSHLYLQTGVHFGILGWQPSSISSCASF